MMVPAGVSSVMLRTSWLLPMRQPVRGVVRKSTNTDSNSATKPRTARREIDPLTCGGVRQQRDEDDGRYHQTRKNNIDYERNEHSSAPVAMSPTGLTEEKNQINGALSRNRTRVITRLFGFIAMASPPNVWPQFAQESLSIANRFNASRHNKNAGKGRWSRDPPPREADGPPARVAI